MEAECQAAFGLRPSVVHDTFEHFQLTVRVRAAPSLMDLMYHWPPPDKSLGPARWGALPGTRQICGIPG